MSDSVFKIGEAGLNVAEEKVKKLMNKMVNAQTPGFKGSDVVVRSFPQELALAEQKQGAMIPRVEGSYYNSSQGALVPTGKLTDLALDSKGFFVIQGTWGEGFTRDGRFEIDNNGYMVTAGTKNKYPLLGRNGPIQVPSRTDISISQSGVIKANGQAIDQIRVRAFSETEFNNLASLNGSIFRTSNDAVIGQEIDTPRIVQGYYESANVSVINETRDLITTQREATGNTEIIKARNSNLANLLTITKNQ